MTYLPRNKVAPYSLKLYKTLGALLKDYRSWRALSQESLAELSGISVRELQNWEADRCNIRIENLHDLVESTGIPMPACVALNAKQPIWYSLGKRRFAYSAVEETLFLSYELVKHKAEADNKVITSNYPITKEKHIRMILSCHEDIYRAMIPITGEAIEAASRILPDFNRIVFDSWGHYVGHQVCFPIKHEFYQQLRKQMKFEVLTANAMSDIIAQQEGVLYAHSSYMASISVVHSIIINNYRGIAKMEPKEKYLAARIELAAAKRNSDANLEEKTLLIASKAEGSSRGAEMVPVMQEIRLDAMMKKVEKIPESSKMWE